MLSHNTVWIIFKIVYHFKEAFKALQIFLEDWIY